MQHHSGSLRPRIAEFAEGGARLQSSGPVHANELPALYSRLADITANIAEPGKAHDPPLVFQTRYRHSRSAGMPQTQMNRFQKLTWAGGPMFLENLDRATRGRGCVRAVSQPVGNHQRGSDSLKFPA